MKIIIDEFLKLHRWQCEFVRNFHRVISFTQIIFLIYPFINSFTNPSLNFVPLRRRIFFLIKFTRLIAFSIASDSIDGYQFITPVLFIFKSNNSIYQSCRWCRGWNERDCGGRKKVEEFKVVEFWVCKGEIKN